MTFDPRGAAVAAAILALLLCPGQGRGSDGDLAIEDVEKCVTSGLFCVLVVPPDRHTAWGYSTDLGRWSKINVHLPAGDLVRFAKMEYAALEGEDAVYVFSKNTCTWTTLERRPGPFKWLSQGESMAVLAMGNCVYTYSPRTAVWTGVDLLRSETR